MKTEQIRRIAGIIATRRSVLKRMSKKADAKSPSCLFDEGFVKKLNRDLNYVATHLIRESGKIRDYEEEDGSLQLEKYYVAKGQLRRFVSRSTQAISFIDSGGEVLDYPKRLLPASFVEDVKMIASTIKEAKALEEYDYNYTIPRKEQFKVYDFGDGRWSLVTDSSTLDIDMETSYVLDDRYYAFVKRMLRQHAKKMRKDYVAELRGIMKKYEPFLVVRDL